MPRMEIKRRMGSAVLFAGEFETMTMCVEAARMSGADLSGADLSRANLSRANLLGANLSDANLSDANLPNNCTATGSPLRRATRSDGYEFLLWPTYNGWRIAAGCRWFTFEEAREHWGGSRENGQQSLNDEAMDILTMFSLAIDRDEDMS